MKDISRWGDLMAIPFFFVMSLYFADMENKTPFEWILFAFSVTGLFADIYFSFLFIRWG